MRRLFWMALGATAGVLLVRRVDRAVQSVTPAALTQSLAASITVLGEAIRDFTLDVREGMAEREAELRSDLGLDGADPRAALDAPPAAHQPPDRQHSLRRPPRRQLPGRTDDGWTEPDHWTGRHS